MQAAGIAATDAARGIGWMLQTAGGIAFVIAAQPFSDALLGVPLPRAARAALLAAVGRTAGVMVRGRWLPAETLEGMLARSR